MKRHYYERIFWFSGLAIILIVTWKTSVASNTSEETLSKEPKVESIAKHEAKSTRTEQSEESVSPASEVSSCLVSETALEDLKKAKEEISLKTKEIAARELELKAREAAVSEEIKKLNEVRDSITKVDEANKKDHAERLDKLTETVFTMNPKSAAKLLSSLDDELAVSIISKMDTQKLAKIINLMNPEYSSHLSEMLAGIKKPEKTLKSDLKKLPTNAQLNGKGGREIYGNDNKLPATEPKS